MQDAVNLFICFLQHIIQQHNMQTWFDVSRRMKKQPLSIFWISLNRRFGGLLQSPFGIHTMVRSGWWIRTMRIYYLSGWSKPFVRSSCLEGDMGSRKRVNHGRKADGSFEWSRQKSSISAIMAIIADMLQNPDKMTLLEWHMFAILDIWFGGRVPPSKTKMAQSMIWWEGITK